VNFSANRVHLEAPKFLFKRKEIIFAHVENNKSCGSSDINKNMVFKKVLSFSMKYHIESFLNCWNNVEPPKNCQLCFYWSDVGLK
jgi:hypothetical protein